jgi:hypothetical protein
MLNAAHETCLAMFRHSPCLKLTRDLMWRRWPFVMTITCVRFPGTVDKTVYP